MEFRRSEVLAKALARLRENLGLVGQASSPEWKRAARDAAIQSFEFTYELAIKVIETSTRVRSKQPEGYRTFGDLMRAAADTRVIASREQWQGFRELRNLSSHTYNETLADRLLAAIPAFEGAVATLLNEVAVDASA